MPGERRVDAIIFDLGGVICDFDFDLGHRYFADRLGLSPREISERFDYASICAPFERGEMTPPEFVAHVNSRFGSVMSADEIVAGWNAIFLGYRPGIAEVVDTAAHRVRCVVLSNTNAIHTEFWRPRYRDVTDRMERLFASQEMGARKPEHRAYRIVLDYLNLPPSRVAFFDDVPEFVAAAREVGIQAFVVTDAAGIARDLQGLGVT